MNDPELTSLLAVGCAVLADGDSELTGVAFTPAVAALVAALRALEADITAERDGEILRVAGCGGHIPASDGCVDAGRHARAAEVLLAILAVARGEYTIAGDPAVDVAPVVNVLTDVGAVIGYGDQPGRLPVNVLGRGLRWGQLRVAAAALPALPAVLIALPCAADDVLLQLPAGADLSAVLGLMSDFGVSTLLDRDRLIVPAPQRYRGCALRLPPSA
ncbi:MAG: 3-phosphoshikimate 1-carboxyvinyltransferase [Phycisphaerae bacterium]|nr:3-phosphoshikimate 1-carboxyvinyltransferase [Phycisphaerae bacterium]